MGLMYRLHFRSHRYKYVHTSGDKRYREQVLVIIYYISLTLLHVSCTDIRNFLLEFVYCAHLK